MSAWRNAAIGLATLSSAAALAQVPPGVQLPSQVEPRVPLPPPPTRVPEAELDFSITAPRRTPQPRSVDAIQFDVRDIRVEGATVFSRAELAPILDPLIGRKAGLGDITAAAEAIEARYRARGLILSRAFVPPQRVADGVFRIQVVEGYIADVVVEGEVDEATRARIARQLGPAQAARPADVVVLERSLLLVNDLPGVAAGGVLRPSPDRQGAADLAVVAEFTPASFYATVDNRGSRFTGPWSAYGEAQLNSFLGFGEQLTLGLSSTLQTREQRTARLTYSQPLGGDGLTAGFSASYSKGNPGYTLEPFDVRSRSVSFGPRLSYPLIRSRGETLTLDGGFTATASDVDVLGVEFTRDRLRVFDIRATYSESGFLDGASSAVLGIARGIEGLGSSEAGEDDLSRARGRPDFTKATLELRHNRSIVGTFSAALLLQGQYSFDPLLAGEEATFGGPRIGRAYDPSEISGDHGIGGSLELRWDERLDWGPLEAVQGYGFYDLGRVWSRGGDGSRTVSSAGFGLRTFMAWGLAGGLEVAAPIARAPATTEGSMTPRVLVNLSIRF